MKRMNSIEKSRFGVMESDGAEAEVYAYTLTDEDGQSVVMLDYGCTIQKICVFDKDKKLTDVALGYDRLDDYIADTRHFGSTIGRYANRIAGGSFTLGGVTYNLDVNDGANSLHGGRLGFDRHLFTSNIWGDAVVFTYESPDLEEGFPGNFSLTVTVTFSGGALNMNYEYVCDRDTPASITNHNYFNLNGHGSGNIFNHKIQINADKFCRADDGLLALAPAVSVEGTPFDLRQPRPILDGILSHSADIVRAGGGYDHCFALNQTSASEPAAVAVGENGIRMEVYSDMPALQFYTGNKIGQAIGKGGAVYNTFDGFALECQQFPNAMNEPSFPSPVIKAGQTVNTFIRYRFS